MQIENYKPLLHLRSGEQIYRAGNENPVTCTMSGIQITNNAHVTFVTTLNKYKIKKKIIKKNNKINAKETKTLCKGTKQTNRNVTIIPFDMCAHFRHKWVCLCIVWHEFLSSVWRNLGGCADLPETLLFAHVQLIFKHILDSCNLTFCDFYSDRSLQSFTTIRVNSDNKRYNVTNVNITIMAFSLQ